MNARYFRYVEECLDLPLGVADKFLIRRVLNDIYGSSIPQLILHTTAIYLEKFGFKSKTFLDKIEYTEKNERELAKEELEKYRAGEY